jgi:hypothetical protein
VRSAVSLAAEKGSAATIGDNNEKATSNRNCCAADGNIGISPIRSLQYCRWQQYLRMGGFTSYNALHCHVAESSCKYGASPGYTRMQSLWILLTAKATIRKLFLSPVLSFPARSWRAVAFSAGGDGGSGLLEQSKTRSRHWFRKPDGRSLASARLEFLWTVSFGPALSMGGYRTKR